MLHLALSLRKAATLDNLFSPFHFHSHQETMTSKYYVDGCSFRELTHEGLKRNFSLFSVKLKRRCMYATTIDEEENYVINGRYGIVIHPWPVHGANSKLFGLHLSVGISLQSDLIFPEPGLWFR